MTVEVDEGVRRREFLRLAAVGGAMACLPSVLTACADGAQKALAPAALGGANGTSSTQWNIHFDLSTDVGILNFAYAFEQVAAGFFALAVTTGARALESHDLLVLSDVAQHAAIHRDFLKKVLGSSAIATLVTKYTYIDFTSRTSILWGGAYFEDTGTGAYNGAGQYLTSGTNLAVAGTIVSVHARHAAAIRDLRYPRTRSFAGYDVVSAQGLDQALTAQQVLEKLAPFVLNPITISGPTQA
jgi:Ferritin-like domain